jgi:hypothetical protein
MSSVYFVFICFCEFNFIVSAIEWLKLQTPVQIKKRLFFKGQPADSVLLGDDVL